MRRRLIAGNWKMNLTIPEGIALVDAIIRRVKMRPDVEVVVCPPFTSLSAVYEEIKSTTITLGAQNMFWKDSGAFTGQVSPPMLVSTGCTYVILGHSETRGRFGTSDETVDNNLGYFSDTDATINLKVKAALYHNLKPILCCGETLAEREAGNTDSVIANQISNGLAGIEAVEAFDMVVAYEPVWAIGTGKVCELSEAQRVCALVRQQLKAVFNEEAAEKIRVLYGGSVKGSNAAQLLKEPDIDGALVGGASLDADEFKAIIASI
jgi:triosephosphate isomerase